MKIEKVGETYSIFEKTDDPIENERRRKKTILFFGLCLLFFIILGLQIMQSQPSKYTGKEEYYIVEGMQIPTLYKFTGHGNAYMAKEINDLVEGNIKGSFISIYYNEEIPEEKVNTFIEEIQKIGFQKIFYDGSEMYVKNSEDKTKFAYIFMNEIQVKYGVCVSGKYEDILKIKEDTKEGIELNLENNLNTVK